MNHGEVGTKEGVIRQAVGQGGKLGAVVGVTVEADQGDAPTFRVIDAVVNGMGVSFESRECGHKRRLEADLKNN